MRLLLASLFLLTACGDDDGTDPRDGGPRADVGPGPTTDAGPRDSGPGPTTDAGPPPGDALAANVCASAGAVAVSADGTQVAYVTCADPAGAVRIVPTAGGTPVDVAMLTGADPQLVWSPDGAHLAFGVAGAWGIDSVDGATPVTLATSGVEAVRFVTAGAETRLLVLESTPTGRRVTARSSADGYAAALEIVAPDPTYMGGLAYLSGSGNSLFFTAQADSRWQRAPTNEAGAVVGLPFTVGEGAMAVVGLGDTHAIVRVDGGLSWIELASYATHVVAADGVLADDRSLLLFDESPTVRWYYFVRNGDPSRWQRGSTATTAEPIVAADATALALAPDGSRLVYPSGGTLQSVATIPGSSPEEIIAGLGDVSALTIAFAPDSSELIVLAAAGSLRRAPLAAPGMSVRLDSSADAASIGYDAASRRAFWQRDGVLFALDAGAAVGETATIASNVDGWWPLPGTDAILYRTTDGTLRRLAP